MKTESVRHSGLAMVEFAVILPILLLLMLAGAEVGRALYQFDTLQKAVRNGARYYSKVENVYMPATTTLNATGANNARNVVVYGTPAGGGTPVLSGLLPGNVTTSVNAIPAGEYVTVSATYTFQYLPGNPLGAVIALFGGTVGGSIPMNASVTMRVI